MLAKIPCGGGINISMSLCAVWHFLICAMICTSTLGLRIAMRVGTGENVTYGDHIRNNTCGGGYEAGDDISNRTKEQLSTSTQRLARIAIGIVFLGAIPMKEYISDAFA